MKGAIINYYDKLRSLFACLNFSLIILLCEDYQLEADSFFEHIDFKIKLKTLKLKL